MFVKCPQCRAKFKIEKEKIESESSSFKCLKCGAVLKVNRLPYSLAYFLAFIFLYIGLAGILAAIFEEGIMVKILGIIMCLSAIGVIYILNVKVFKKYVVSSAYKIILVIMAVLIYIIFIELIY